MSRIKVNTEVSIGNILIAVSLLVAAVLAYGNIGEDISAEAHARELADTKLGAQLENTSIHMSNVSTVLADLVGRVGLNDAHRISTEARAGE